MRLARVSAAALLAVALAAVVPGLALGQLASRPADDWIKTLEAPARVAGLRIDEVVARLRLRPGQVVADLGAGSGLFAFPLARAVAPGRVYAVELDEGFLAFIRNRSREQGVANVVPVLGLPADPSLPVREIDVAFFHDVLHHVADRAAYLTSVARYLKPDGRVAIIEYGAGQSPHRDQPELVVTKEQAAAWLAAAGLAPAEEFDLFTDKWFVVYERRRDGRR
jgi:ubiquinone/menaquinone biosynthesis C-methylase UbiE